MIVLMTVLRTLFISIICCSFISSCTEVNQLKPLRVGFNTWPGYEFIYLAEIKEFYKKHNLKVKLVELNSLGDVRRAFERGQIDIMASTMVELLIAAENTGKSLKIIAVADASNGADVLISKRSIKSIGQLKGKKIGMEGATVDVLVAGAALRSSGLSLKDVTVVGKAQDDLVAEINAGSIDAMQTYPPYSIKLLKTGKYHKLFDTSKIAGEIIDILSVDETVLKERKDDIDLFLKAYFDAYEYFKSNIDESSTIMGKREGISGEEFKEAIGEMIIFSKEQQAPYLLADSLGGKILKNASGALHDSGWLKGNVNISQFFINE